MLNLIQDAFSWLFLPRKALGWKLHYFKTTLSEMLRHLLIFLIGVPIKKIGISIEVLPSQKRREGICPFLDHLRLIRILHSKHFIKHYSSPPTPEYYSVCK